MSTDEPRFTATRAELLDALTHLKADLPWPPPIRRDGTIALNAESMADSIIEALEQYPAPDARVATGQPGQAIVLDSSGYPTWRPAGTRGHSAAVAAHGALAAVLRGDDDFARREVCSLEDAGLDRLREAFGWLDTECCEELSRRHS